MSKRAILIVLDSVGIGELPDAAEFDDVGANTLGHIQERHPLNIPNMRKLGIGHIQGSPLPRWEGPVEGAYGKCMEVTHAKDTTCGHWEMAGLIQKTAFKTFPNGFPKALMDEFEAKIGRGTLGNEVASGTEIIERLGDEHVATGKPIIYTSADSVFQVAACEEIIPLKELYRICEIAREMLQGEYLVGRVIARPFTKKDGKYVRTENRKDYAIPPFEDTILDGLHAQGLPVVAIGKIEDIFCHRGIDLVDHTKNNETGVAATERFIADGTGSFIFTNLVDFDMLYGHRRDVEGYARALERFDEQLPDILGRMKDEDILFITADHGCDPAHHGTDHTREHIPLLVAGKHVKGGVDLGVRRSFADIAATIYDYLTGTPWHAGESFLKDILK